jgi:hypothetical protein
MHEKMASRTRHDRDYQRDAGERPCGFNADGRAIQMSLGKTVNLFYWSFCACGYFFAAYHAWIGLETYDPYWRHLIVAMLVLSGIVVWAEALPEVKP